MRLAALVVALLSWAAPLMAQQGVVPLPLPLRAIGNPQCADFHEGDPSGPQARNVCNAAIDGAALFAPVAGILVAAGNPLLGSSHGLGVLGRVAITLRVNATDLVIPDLSYDGSGTTVGAKRTVLAPAPLVEGGMGIFRGTRGGSFALDLLGSAQLLPTRLIDDVSIDVNARSIGTIAVGLGIGGRLTIFAPRGAVPGVSVSVMHRSLPRIGVGDVIKGDAYSFASDLGTTDYRATIGTHLGPVAVGVGGGWTVYHSNGDVIVRDPLTGDPDAPLAFDLRDSRTLGFVDGGLVLGSVYLIGEAGVQQGKDLGLATTFENNDPRHQRVFGSIGLRLGF